MKSTNIPTSKTATYLVSTERFTSKPLNFLIRTLATRGSFQSRRNAVWKGKCFNLCPKTSVPYRHSLFQLLRSEWQVEPWITEQSEGLWLEATVLTWRRVECGEQVADASIAVILRLDDVFDVSNIHTESEWPEEEVGMRSRKSLNCLTRSRCSGLVAAWIRC